MIYRKAHDIILDDIFLSLEGFIPQTDVVLKIEGLNPAGSIKLKTAVGLIEDLEKRGELSPFGHVIESSSGNLGIALSLVCASRRYGFTCVVDPNTSQQSIALMRTFGAQVVVVERPDQNGGFLSSRIDYIRQRLKREPELTWPNQYANPANPAVHYERTAASIIKQGLEVDYLFIGAGTTGTLMGCSEYFRQHSPHTRIVAVDTVGSVTFGFDPGKRHIPGLGTSRKPEIFREGKTDSVVMVSERDAVRMCRTLAIRHGICAGGSTGSVLAAIEQERARIPPGAGVVAIAPDIGERYLATVFDDAWVAERFRPDDPPDTDTAPFTSSTTLHASSH